MWAKNVDWSQLAKSRVMDCCDYCNKISDFIKGENDCVPWSQIINISLRFSQDVIVVFVTTADVCCL